MLFHELYTIYVVQFSAVIPVLYALLPKKARATSGPENEINFVLVLFRSGPSYDFCVTFLFRPVHFAPELKTMRSVVTSG